MNKYFTVCALVACALVAGCSTTSINQNPMRQGYEITDGVEHLNRAVDPNGPSAVYENCSAGEFEIKAATSSSTGNTHSGHSSQRCAPVTTRGDGYNPSKK